MTTISPVVVPYAGGIPGGVRQGMEIEIQGTVPHHSHTGFSINLSGGPQIEPNTAFHFNVRMNEHCVVMNHLQNNSWGGEERKHGQHFHKGRPFDLRIMVKPQMYKVKLNGQHLADFPHRVPKESAQFLVIKGEVAINFVTFHQGGGGGHGHCGHATAPSAGFAPPPSFGGYPSPSFPSPYPTAGFSPPAGFAPPPSGGYPMGAVPPPQPAMGPQPIFNPPVPFTTGIPGGLAPGRMVTISGVPNPNASRFSVNLQAGMYEGCDVNLHFDVRFRYGDSYNTVVRTHYQGGAWGQEEKGVAYFPFVPNANFDMIILTELQSFKVAVNNQHLVEFRHRLPYQTAQALHIKGDVRLTQVRFQ